MKLIYLMQLMKNKCSNLSNIFEKFSDIDINVLDDEGYTPYIELFIIKI